MYAFFTITAKQIGILQGTCYSTALKEWHRVRDILEIPSRQPLRLRDLALAWNADAKQIGDMLFNHRPQKFR